jgi:hypothetical protein
MVLRQHNTPDLSCRSDGPAEFHLRRRKHSPLLMTYGGTSNECPVFFSGPANQLVDEIAAHPTPPPICGRDLRHCRKRVFGARQIHHVGKRAVRTFQPVHAGKAFVGDDGDIGPSRRFIARTRHRKPYASDFGGGREPMISCPMGRRTETSMAPSSRRQRLAALVADRVARCRGEVQNSATQVETLRRLRSAGSQVVRVEHVHVNGGQDDARPHAPRPGASAAYEWRKQTRRKEA